MDIERFGPPYRFRSRNRGMWRDIDDLHNRMEQMMDMIVSTPTGLSEVPPREGSGAIGRYMYPLAVDVQETENEYILKADVPGIPKEDIKIQVTQDGNLTLSGERKQETSEQGEGFFKAERSYGKFSRTFKLPDINPEGVQAKYENGELLLTAPKSIPPPESVRDVSIS
eukprot:TRINITY_DN30415_c0_g1_i2.p2 TRINITY_DN30415_c0_g1~~TRINITY_DN30415_c0_g1_i2.p2  ORF type:complete len:169 (-),score=20.57 TRINITY_DN30415_c0_g1_i2:261-767(-)